MPQLVLDTNKRMSDVVQAKCHDSQAGNLDVHNRSLMYERERDRKKIKEKRHNHI